MTQKMTIKNDDEIIVEIGLIMEKREEIRKLTWKYFIQQKVEEISKPIIYVLLAIIIPFTLALIDGYDWLFFDGGSIFLYLFVIWGIFFILSLAIWCGLMIVWLVFITVFEALKGWIKSNWKQASKKAQNEVYKKQKRRKK